VTEFADVDSAIAAHHADRVKVWQAQAARSRAEKSPRIGSPALPPASMQPSRTFGTAVQLRGLAELWLPTGADQTPRPVRLPPGAGRVSAEEPQHPPLMRPEAKQAAAWRSFHVALLADPEAAFEGAS
jgi:hypothetical protein